jgi:hypothetical protein
MMNLGVTALAQQAPVVQICGTTIDPMDQVVNLRMRCWRTAFHTTPIAHDDRLPQMVREQAFRGAHL